MTDEQFLMFGLLYVPTAVMNVLSLFVFRVMVFYLVIGGRYVALPPSVKNFSYLQIMVISFCGRDSFASITIAVTFL
jgi:hypothetical protein